MKVCMSMRRSVLKKSLRVALKPVCVLLFVAVVPCLREAAAARRSRDNRHFVCLSVRENVSHTISFREKC